MTRHLTLGLLLLVPSLALAQTEAAPPEQPPAAPAAALPQQDAAAPAAGAEPASAAPAAPPNWSLGVGLGLASSSDFFFGYDASSYYASGGGLMYPGGSYLADGAPAVGSVVAPRLAVVAERRASGNLFVTFQVAASYGQTQNQLKPDLKNQRLDLEGEIGVRHVLNPKGIVELSWFATVGARYLNWGSRFETGVYDANRNDYVPEQRVQRGHTFAVGALVGLVLERELIEDLSLRASTSILGASYGLTSAHLWTPSSSTDTRAHEFDVGLHLSPMLALRYAF